MADTSHCTSDDWIKWADVNQVLDNGIKAKLTGLTVSQKQKLTELMDKWIANLKP
jgi:type IV pilus biogenesis protein CpaD/CtpE